MRHRVLRYHPRTSHCLTDILRETAEQSGLGVTAAGLARVIVGAMQSFKQTAQSADEMRHLIAVQVSTVERALIAGPQPAEC
jgi:hypothetical protein